MEEELDESKFFLKFLEEFNHDKKVIIARCWKEGNELLSIIVASLNTLRINQAHINRT